MTNASTHDYNGRRRSDLRELKAGKVWKDKGKWVIILKKANK